MRKVLRVFRGAFIFLLLFLTVVSVATFLTKDVFERKPWLLGEFVSSFVEGQVLVDEFRLVLYGGTLVVEMSWAYLPEGSLAKQGLSELSGKSRVTVDIWKSLRTQHLVINLIELNDIVVLHPKTRLAEFVFDDLPEKISSLPFFSILLDLQGFIGAMQKVIVGGFIRNLRLSWNGLSGITSDNVFVVFSSGMTELTTMHGTVLLGFSNSLGRVEATASYRVKQDKKQPFWQLEVQTKSLDIAKILPGVVLSGPGQEEETAAFFPQGRYSVALSANFIGTDVQSVQGVAKIEHVFEEFEWDDTTLETLFRYDSSTRSKILHLFGIDMSHKGASIFGGDISIIQTPIPNFTRINATLQSGAINPEVFELMDRQIPLLSEVLGRYKASFKGLQMHANMVFQHGREWTISHILRGSALPSLSLARRNIRMVGAQASLDATRLEIDFYEMGHILAPAIFENPTTLSFTAGSVLVWTKWLPSPCPSALPVSGHWEWSLTVHDMAVEEKDGTQGYRRLGRLHADTVRSHFVFPELLVQIDRSTLHSIVLEHMRFAVKDIKSPFLMASGKVDGRLEALHTVVETIPFLQTTLETRIGKISKHVEGGFAVTWAFTGYVGEEPIKVTFPNWKLSNEIVLREVEIQSKELPDIHLFYGNFRLTVNPNGGDVLVQDTLLRIDEGIDIAVDNGLLTFGPDGVTNGRVPLQTYIQGRAMEVSLLEYKHGELRFRASAALDGGDLRYTEMEKLRNIFDGRANFSFAGKVDFSSPLRPKISHLRIYSDLRGMKISIPPPFYKERESKTDFMLYFSAGGNQDLGHLFWENAVDVKVLISQMYSSGFAARLVFQAKKASEHDFPLQVENVNISGNLGVLNWNAWYSFLKDPDVFEIIRHYFAAPFYRKGAKDPTTIVFTDLKLPEASIKMLKLGIRREKVASVTRQHIYMSSALVEGRVILHPHEAASPQHTEAESGPFVAKIQADFEYLDADRVFAFIRKFTAGWDGKEDDVIFYPSSWPVLQLTAKRLILRGKKAYDASVVIKPDKKGLQLADLQLQPLASNRRLTVDDFRRLPRDGSLLPICKLTASGHWKIHGKPKLSVRFSVDSLEEDRQNMGEFLVLSEIYEGLRGGSGRIWGQLSWENSWNKIRLEDTEGQVLFAIKDGKLEEGEASEFVRFLGLFNIGSWTKLLTLNFKQFFDSGLSFRDMKGKLAFRDKKMFIDDFKIDSELMGVEISGFSDLENEMYHQTIDFRPKFVSNASWLAILSAAPLAASGLVLEELLGTKDNPVRKLVSMLDSVAQKLIVFRYQITGNWDNPKFSATPLQ